ncbi:KpsF/GutQ family sugar-phosphate isomerase [Pseudobacteriovorax antillogorgiicola]|uniref:Arabinose-5-phosphate isomerase n=1 Tax=Pseudobacteriovorax antillogorgiicola TaxID=1513793 RepID=A0A1Y6B6U6_9BACT|nr:KpsF/GutQ family sugar-phosphate isomerase [Pseudobacteriovorax antillogorgiicola]TCS59134.1 arabinose-5-phosphate isomerase [Pseudobacteriovorax antillogorgiicola]SME91311.1 arabinose-5-phosphate isomerase [Pseudobacteriovorax antillogorgiicola]
MAVNRDAIVAWGRETIRAEIESLKQTTDVLDGSFTDAVEAILRSEGKVVVAGLGKSGHVGRKLSATLASTGTSSFFLHPAEALHGDLGMMDAGDILLAIAFGGETMETVEVAKAARRNGQTIIAITGKLESTLASLADIVLDGGVVSEACPLNLAPTSSTTVAMAIGDALAVSLMKARGFREEDFAAFHPGGSLGRKLSLVKDHIRCLPLKLSLDDGFHRILEVITQQNFGIAGVFDAEGSLVGAISDGDLRRALIDRESNVFTATAKDFVRGKPKSILDHTLAVDAVNFMEQQNVSSLFVQDDQGVTLGLIRMYDLLAAKIV